MDTALYKARRVNNGAWVEGYLIKSFTGICYIVTHFDHILGSITDYEVDEKTICRYTGMTINDTQKIWENDIVVAKEDYCPAFGSDIFVAKGTYYQAFWYDERYQFTFKCIKTKNAVLLQDIWDLRSLARMTKLKVVGNVFDNPKLT